MPLLDFEAVCGRLLGRLRERRKKLQGATLQVVKIDKPFGARLHCASLVDVSADLVLGAVLDVMMYVCARALRPCSGARPKCRARLCVAPHSETDEREKENSLY